ncbi:glycosyltransferase family 2 protein [Aeromonas enteropelogenes]|uniref:Acyltransferase n=1 Tax=Aeromonas enteropelogenes TaxID=29489 RepID=A0A175VN58_AEREN|nr:glycosyltransferase family 2 protein [Aeromonas enteropelogenes]KXU81970.1 acyltransferase [Aeromonas enteropelogenes]
MTPCLIIPCYNHAAPLAGVLDELAPLGLPCLLVDDGSEPVAAARLDQLAAEHATWVTLLRHEHNRGKGGAVKTALLAARDLGFSHALQVDADGQHDLARLPDLLAEAQRYPEALISGAPQYDESVPKGRLYGRYLTHVWVWIETLSFEIKDSMCGLRVYPVATSCDLLEQCALGERMDFDIEVMVRLHWRGVQVRFIPVKVHYPEDGLSHFNPLHDNLRISWMHTRLVLTLLRDGAAHLLRWPKRLLNKGKAHWSRTPERGTLLGIRTLLWSYRLLGRPGFRVISLPVIAYFWLTGRRQREASRNYLARLTARAGQLGHPLPERVGSLRHFLRFGEAALDKLAAWRGDIRLDDIELVNREHYEAARGQGALIIGSHLGNLELCRALGSQEQGVRITALVFTRHAARFNALMQEVNPDSGLNLVQVQELGPDTAIMLKSRIEAGEWVVIVGDRTSVTKEKRVVWADFLGEKAPFPLGPFALSAVLGCPTYLMFGLREQGRFRVHFEPFADGSPLPRPERQQRLEARVQHYADRLEYHCLHAPLEWFNFFDFWHLTDEQD